MKTIQSLIVFLCIIFVSSAFSGEADVVDVKISKTGKTTFSFSVSVKHEDTGWKHYVNKWDIVDDNGKVFGTRILHHPHVDEQPFTRSLSGVEIPQSIKTVVVQAHDSVHEYGGKTVSVKLP